MKQERVETVPTAIRLPREMHDRLRESDLGVSEAIRRRVELTFQQDAIDPITRGLATGVVNLAAAVKAFVGAEWHSHQEVHAVFAAALACRLAAYKPPPRGALALKQLAQKLGDAAARELQQSPIAVGAVIERVDANAHSYEHLRATPDPFRKEGEDKS
jgi:hypothetical protein